MQGIKVKFMKKFFFILFALLVTSASYAIDPEISYAAKVLNTPSISEELTLKGQYCTGKAGYFGSWRMLYLNGNQVGIDEEVLIHLDLDGATLIQWEFNPAGGNGTVFISELNLNSGTIRFNPRSGNVVTFTYILEKGSSTKEGSCSFVIR